MRYTLLTIMTAASSLLFGQGITNEGNSWIYLQLNWETQEVTDLQFRIEGDTLINNILYKTILRSDHPNYPVWYPMNVYIREEGKRVFIIDSTGVESVLYDFSLQLGDEIEVWNGYTAKVTLIDSVEMSPDHYLKHWKLKLMSSDQSCWSTANWIEDVGSYSGLIPVYCPSFNLSFGFQCHFRQEALYYPYENSYCDPFVTSSDHPEISNFEVFPNPVTDVLEIKGIDPENASITITDFSGRLHNEFERMGNLIFVNKLASGIYFLRIQSEDINVVRKFVKI